MQHIPRRSWLRSALALGCLGWVLACSGAGLAPAPEPAEIVEPWSGFEGLPVDGATVAECDRGHCVFEHGKTVDLKTMRPYFRAMKRSGYERMESDPVHRVQSFIEQTEGGAILNISWGSREETSTQVTISFM